MNGLSAAERLILRWDSTTSEEESRNRMLFDGDHRAQAERYLRAVDEIRRLSLRNSPDGDDSRRSDSLKLAMARLGDEFHHVLISRVNDIDSEFLFSDLSSVSLGRSSRYEGDVEEREEELGGDEIARTETTASMVSSRLGSISSIAEIDLVPSDAVHDLRSIAEQMIAAGYEKECFQAYVGVRKSAVDDCLRRLGVENLSINDVPRLPWDALGAKIRRWIHAARASVHVVFASERRLCDLIFDGLNSTQSNGGSASDVPFDETVKPAALQLFGFAEAISVGKRSPEKIFKILDLHDALRDLLPDIEVVFSGENSSDSPFYTQVVQTLSQLAEAVRGIVAEFENAVYSELSKSPVPGGTIHPLTRYVMNYISLISDYKQTLTELIVSVEEKRSTLSDLEIPETEGLSPLASHLIWIIAVLISNLESKSKLYKDSALSHIFLMNNVHYIVHKAKGSPELREMIGDDYLKKLTGKYQKEAVNYQRAAWVKVLYCLRDEGIHVNGSFSSGISKTVLRDRFKSFNAAFDESHRTQSAWLVPDVQLREELRILISERLIPAYRFFLGRYKHHIENGKHPELYIKYSTENLEDALDDFFEGSPPSQLSRRTTH